MQAGPGTARSGKRDILAEFGTMNQYARRLGGFGFGDHGNPTRTQDAGRGAGALDAL